MVSPIFRSTHGAFDVSITIYRFGGNYKVVLRLDRNFPMKRPIITARAVKALDNFEKKLLFSIMHLNFTAKAAKKDELKDVVRQHRRLSGLSQRELAKLAGVGKTVVFDIEHGKESVQFDTLKKVLGALNIQVVLQSPILERQRKLAVQQTPHS